MLDTAICYRRRPRGRESGLNMADRTYVVNEIVGTSPVDVNTAIRNGVNRASKTLRNLDWFEVKEIRGHLEDGKVADWQVRVKLGFRHESSGS